MNKSSSTDFAQLAAQLGMADNPKLQLLAKLLEQNSASNQSLGEESAEVKAAKRRKARHQLDFTQIDGLNVLTVQTILSEVGLDPSRFPTS